MLPGGRSGRLQANEAAGWSRWAPAPKSSLPLPNCPYAWQPADRSGLGRVLARVALQLRAPSRGGDAEVQDHRVADLPV